MAQSKKTRSVSASGDGRQPRRAPSRLCPRHRVAASRTYYSRAEYAHFRDSVHRLFARTSFIGATQQLRSTPQRCFGLACVKPT